MRLPLALGCPIPTLLRGRETARGDYQAGYVSVRGNNVFYPSIGVNDEGEGVMAFSLSGADFSPSSAYVRINKNGVSSIGIAAAGVAPEDGFTGYPQFGGFGSGRWGDYTAAVADGNTIWFASEHIPGGRRANWGTFIAPVSSQNEGEQ